MPDRLIRERCRRSPTLRLISDAAERAWWRLTVTADDYGRFDADPEVLLSQLFERKPAGWTIGKMARVIEEWAREDVQLVHLYQLEGDERLYGHAVTWTEHQRERDSKPKYPDPPCGNSPQLAAKCRESRQSAAYSEGRGSVGSEGRKDPKPRGGDSAAPSEDNGWGHPEQLVALYNAMTPNECPAVTKVSPARKQKAITYLKAFPDKEFWQRIFHEIGKSRFLRGLEHSADRKPFVADFDWLLTKGKDGTENAVKVAEGKYQDRGA